jgi:hypothetical protein
MCFWSRCSCMKLRALSLSFRSWTISLVVFSLSRDSTCFTNTFMCSWLPRQYASKISPKRTDTDGTCISDLQQISNGGNGIKQNGRKTWLQQSRHSGFWPFVITHFNTIVLTFVTCLTNHDETVWLANQLPPLSCHCAYHSELGQAPSFNKWGWLL